MNNIEIINKAFFGEVDNYDLTSNENYFKQKLNDLNNIVKLNVLHYLFEKMDYKAFLTYGSNPKDMYRLLEKDFTVGIVYMQPVGETVISLFMGYMNNEYNKPRRMKELEISEDVMRFDYHLSAEEIYNYIQENLETFILQIKDQLDEKLIAYNNKYSQMVEFVQIGINEVVERINTFANTHYTVDKYQNKFSNFTNTTLNLVPFVTVDELINSTKASVKLSFDNGKYSKEKRISISFFGKNTQLSIEDCKNGLKKLEDSIRESIINYLNYLEKSLVEEVSMVCKYPVYKSDISILDSVKENLKGINKFYKSPEVKFMSLPNNVPYDLENSAVNSNASNKDIDDFRYYSKIKKFEDTIKEKLNIEISLKDVKQAKDIRKSLRNHVKYVIETKKVDFESNGFKYTLYKFRVVFHNLDSISCDVAYKNGIPISLFTFNKEKNKAKRRN